MRRVVVTGMGVITPLGTGKEALWDSVCKGRSAVRKITHFDASPFKSQIAATVDDFDDGQYMDAKSPRGVDRFSLFSVAAARMALDDPRLTIDSQDGCPHGAYVGSALG